MTDDQRKLAEHMIAALDAPSKELTPWELQFYESVSEQFDNRRWLSDRQMEILERIYTEKA